MQLYMETINLWLSWGVKEAQVALRDSGLIKHNGLTMQKTWVTKSSLTSEIHTGLQAVHQSKSHSFSRP